MSAVELSSSAISLATSGRDVKPIAELRVLTLNVWIDEAPKRCGDQVAALRAVDPDIFCLQEAFSMKVARTFEEAFAQEYEVVRFQSRLSYGAVLSLTVYTFILSLVSFCLWCIDQLVVSGQLVLQSCVIGAFGTGLSLTILTLYTNPKNLVDFLFGNKTGLMLLAKRSVIEHMTTDVSLFKEWRYDYLNWVRPRGYVQISGFLNIQEEGNDVRVPFKVVTSHLDQVITQKEGHGRIAQAREIMRRELDGFKGLVVMAGDWNCTPHDNPGGTRCGTYDAMRLEMDDAWHGDHGLGATWDQVGNPLAVSKANDMAYQNTELLQWRCDITFWKNTTSQKVCVKSCEILFQPPELVSDHYGLLTTFSF
eukprot:TRINITY_DN26789_c0_g1_i1.p1 TRINITY_DN26789_c0_g1~~TRINITY_DN26789_c0_g1_i1.p1  ORF type:complete len:365 (-),score=50.69 TRINITY_DN26789_c0_g1_i1:53-1147(-)